MPTIYVNSSTWYGSPQLATVYGYRLPGTNTFVAYDSPRTSLEQTVRLGKIELLPASDTIQTLSQNGGGRHRRLFLPNQQLELSRTADSGSWSVFVYDGASYLASSPQHRPALHAVGPYSNRSTEVVAELASHVLSLPRPRNEGQLASPSDQLEAALQAVNRTMHDGGGRSMTGADGPNAVWSTCVGLGALALWPSAAAARMLLAMFEHRVPWVSGLEHPSDVKTDSGPEATRQPKAQHHKLAHLCCTAAQIHTRLTGLAVCLPSALRIGWPAVFDVPQRPSAAPSGSTEATAGSGQGLTPEDRMQARWAAADAVARIGLDIIAGLLLVSLYRALACTGPRPMAASVRSDPVLDLAELQQSVLGLVMQGVNGLQDAASQPWLASLSGTDIGVEMASRLQGSGDGSDGVSSWGALAHATGAAHVAGRKMAALLLLVLQLWRSLFTSYVLPYLLSVVQLALLLVVRYGFGMSVLLAVLMDVLSIATWHLKWLAIASGRIYSSAGRILLGLWRLFRGKKRNVLRLRVDTADASAAQLVVGTLLFVPLFLLLPLLAAHYAVCVSLWLGVLALRAGLWWSLTAVNNMPWANVAAHACPALLRRALGLRLPGAGVTIEYLGQSTASNRHGANEGKADGSTVASGPTVTYYRLHSRPSSATDVLVAPFKAAWAEVTTQLPPRKLLMAVLTGTGIPT